MPRVLRAYKSQVYLVFCLVHGPSFAKNAFMVFADNAPEPLDVVDLNCHLTGHLTVDCPQKECASDKRRWDPLHAVSTR